MRHSCRIDNIKDTLAPKAGGIVKQTSFMYNDSVIFHYNSVKQLEMEQIYRTTILNSDPEYPDTSRFYRKYLYDSKGRVLSVQHWTIIGSPHPANPRSWAPFPGGDTYYHHTLQRIDSMAYDSHDKQLFHRRYEPFNFSNKNYTMVIKDGWENEYVYDGLGRLSKENRSFWEQNTKYRRFENPSNPPYTHTYNYEGNTSKIKSRTFAAPAPGSATGFITACDSLYTYDNLGRITSWKTFPYYTAFDGSNYSKPSNFDTIVYSDKYSYQSNGFVKGVISSLDTKTNCSGVRYDNAGRLKFVYGGLTNIGLINSEYNKCSYSAFMVGMNSRVHHYKDDNDGNSLAVDSAYIKKEFISGYTTNETTIYFDTIAYYGFKLIEDPVTSVNDLLNENIVNIYPNPASEYITVLTNGLPGVLHIYGTDGLCCISENVIEKKTTIDISKIQTGIYILELNGHRKKLIKY